MRKLQRTKKAIPAFKSEAEEREFWLKADSTEYVDWTTAGYASDGAQASRE
jgi:hypothetical protein